LAKFKPSLANCYALGQISIVLNGPMFKNNLAIWSQGWWVIKIKREVIRIAVLM